MAILRVLVRFSLVPSKTTTGRSLAVKLLGSFSPGGSFTLGRFWVGGNSCPLLHSQGNGYKPQRITPNIKIELTEAQSRQLAANPALVGTQNDPQYARALTVILTPTLVCPLA